MWSRWGLILVVAMTVAYWPAARCQEPAENLKSFELKVVGPGGKPIPGAEVDLESKPAPTAEQISKGTYLRPSPWGSFAKTDDQGVLVVKLPIALRRFSLVIAIPGYGPYWADWSSEDAPAAIPARFTAELDQAWSVGGIVVDDAGKPVAGAKIRPFIEFKKRPGANQQMGSGGQMTTDAAGHWRFDSVPVSLAEVTVEINHPAFMPFQRPLARGEFAIKEAGAPVAKIVLDRGLTVTGRVTDDMGKPIVGVLIRTQFHNDVREARTGSDGVYRLTGCQPAPARIVAWAPGQATDMKEPLIERGMGPVDFAMKPGGHVSIRVLDHEGKPAAKTRIFFQRWRGRFSYFEFDHVGQYADENGVWTWNEAPLDEFNADICPPAAGMQLSGQPFTARAEEYVIRLPAPLVISGKVVDAETKAAIPEFRVIPGEKSSNTHMFWHEEEGFTAHDGRYHVRPGRTQFAHLFRVEADGYRASSSRDIKSTEGAVTIDFELKKANGIYAKVVTPANVSAAGARIALGVAGNWISVTNGDLDDQSTRCARATADDGGRFHFPVQDKDFELVITHPSGFAHINSPAAWGSARIIRLNAWAKVEGSCRIGRTPAANVPLEISGNFIDSDRKGGPHIRTAHGTTTGPDGRFVFDRVFPGRGRIGRVLTLTLDGELVTAHSDGVPATFPAGKTVHIDLGGSGRAVVGKLQPPDGFTGKVPWYSAFVELKGRTAGDPDDAPFLRAAVDRDGSFRIDDAPAGDYSLSVSFARQTSLRLENHRFTVPAQAGDAAAKTIDLGVLKLEKR